MIFALDEQEDVDEWDTYTDAMLEKGGTFDFIFNAMHCFHPLLKHKVC